MRDLVFTLAPAGDTWTSVGPTPERAPHVVPSPLHDKEFLRQIADFRDLAAYPVTLGTPDGMLQSANLESIAREIGTRLTGALLSDEARAALVTRLHAADEGRAHLTVRVPGDDEESDATLALPWELLLPEAGDFPVRAGTLDVTREAVSEHAPALPAATGPLVLAVSIAAPENVSALHYEEEAYRLQRALETLGHDVAFTDLGDLDDLVRVADGVNAAAIHFSGHGLPGKLVFEDALGFAEQVEIEEVVRRLTVKLWDKGERFPRFFYLASCHGATGGKEGPRWRVDAAAEERGEDERARAVGFGPSTAATLHRNGFAQVLGYFGPISDALSTRAEEAFYGAVAAGKPTLVAVAEARTSMGQEISLGNARAKFPFAWTQLALYHRGPDRALAQQQSSGVTSSGGAPRLQRAEMVVSGMPVLKYGFIGRRGTLHRIRRADREGQRLFVIQGLGGLGKTALAMHLLAKVMAPDPADQVILACGGLDEETMDVPDVLWRQVEEHAERHQVEGWEAKARVLRETRPSPVVGFEQAVEMLRAARPGAVVYADNLETLQEGPAGGGAAVLGSWTAAGKPVWEALERLSGGGRVLVTTRYAWRGLDERAWVRLDPMRGADVLRMVDTWPKLGRLRRSVQVKIAQKVDGHPRTVEFLERLVAERWKDLAPGAVVQDEWKELVEPVLPATAGKVTEDLLLAALWKQLSEAARVQARRMSVLRRPAPWPVVQALGSEATTAELVRAGVVTQFKEQANAEKAVVWVDRWGMQSLVREFVGARAGEHERREAHRTVGEAFNTWVRGTGARWVDAEEGIAHLYAIGDGDLAWPIVEEYATQLRERTQYREAITLLEKCEAGGVSGDRLARALMLIEQMHDQLGEQSEEMRWLLDRSMVLAESNETRAMILHQMASMLKRQGNHSEAESLSRRAVSLVEKELVNSQPLYAALLHSLADALEQQGKYTEAEALLRQSISVFERAPTDNQPSYGAALHSLASMWWRKGEYQEAERLFRQSLAVRGKALGRGHPAYGKSLHGLAGVLAKQGNYREAEELLRRSVAINEETLGSGHPDCCASLDALAGVLDQQGKCAEAEELLRQSVALAENTLGVAHPLYGNLLHNLACTLQRLDKYEEAEGLLRRSLAIKEKTLGVAHPGYGASLHALAGVLSARHEYAEAEDNLRISLAIMERSLGPEHPNFCVVLTNLGVALARQDRAIEAQPLLQRALCIAERVYGSRHPETARIVNTLAQLQSSAFLAQLRQADAAMDVRDFPRVVDLLSPLLTQTQTVASPAAEMAACNLLAQALALTARIDEAIPYARRALAIADELQDVDALRNLGELLAALEPPAPCPTTSFQARIDAAFSHAKSGHAEAAIRDLETVAAEASRANAPGPEASARFAIAEIFVGTGRPHLAVSQYRDALAIAERVGAEDFAAEVRSILQDLEVS